MAIEPDKFPIAQAVGDGPWYRRLWFGVALAVCCVLLVNIIGYRKYKRIDLTQSGYFSLSDKTLKVLQSLNNNDRRVKITVFLLPGNLAYQDMRFIFNAYKEHSDDIEVEIVSPDKNPIRVQQLIEQFKIEHYDTIVVESEGRTRFIKSSELYEWEERNPLDQRPAKATGFRGESILTSAILTVSENRQINAYFTIGHGEMSVAKTGPVHLSKLKARIEQANIRVNQLNLLSASRIPENCDLLIIANPRQVFSPSHIAMLEAYFKRGGYTLVMLDSPYGLKNITSVQSGLKKLVAQWGIEIADDLLLDPAKRVGTFGVGPVTINTYERHPITNSLSSEPMIITLGRSITLDGKERPHVKASALLRSSDKAWGETGLSVKKGFSFGEQDHAGPINLGVVAARLYQEGAQKNVSRLVVLGNSRFVSNQQYIGLDRGPNEDFFMNCIYYLTNRSYLSGIGAKKPEHVRLVLAQSQVIVIAVVVMGLLPLLVVLAGVIVWWRRQGKGRVR